MSFLFGSQNQTVTNNTEIPDWIKGPAQENLTIAGQIAKGEQPPNIGTMPMWTGPRVAPLSPRENMAGAMISNGVSNPNLARATQMAGENAGAYGGSFGASPQIMSGIASAGARTPAEMQRLIASGAQAYGGNFDVGGMNAMTAEYMNPYMDSVMGEIRRQGEIERSQLGRRAAASKAFGGSRQAILEGMQREGEARNIGLQQASAYQRAQDVAGQQQALQFGQQQARAGQFNTEQSRALQAGGALAQIFAGDQDRARGVGDLLSRLQLAAQGMGADQFNRDRAAGMDGARTLADLGQISAQDQRQNIAALLGFGQMERGQQQQQYDTDYQQFVESRDWPLRMLGIRQAALQGSPYPTSTTQNQPGPSIASQGLGSLALLAGLGGKGGFNLFG